MFCFILSGLSNCWNFTKHQLPVTSKLQMGKKFPPYLWGWHRCPTPPPQPHHPLPHPITQTRSQGCMTECPFPSCPATNLSWIPVVTLHPASVMNVCQSSQIASSQVLVSDVPPATASPERTSQKVSSVLCPLCCCSATKLCPTLCDLMDCSMPGSSVLHCLPEFAQIHVHWIDDAIQHLILYRPLLLLPSIFPSIRVFSSETALHIRWLKYWSFRFGISPSSEYSGLISFRINWFDLLAVQGTLKSLFQHHSSKGSILQHSAFFIVQLSHSYKTTGKTIALTIWNILCLIWPHVLIFIFSWSIIAL